MGLNIVPVYQNLNSQKVSEFYVYIHTYDGDRAIGVYGYWSVGSKYIPGSYFSSVT